MIELVPNYYKDFTCKADQCAHTCCAGWEIEIDPETYEIYKNLGGELGREILSHIESSNGTHSFRLMGEDERCPFLDDRGLCRLIRETGNEDLLCNICRDHPRFRHFREGYIETGLGLACEEAARIILGAKEPFRLVRKDEEASANPEEIPVDPDEIYAQRDRDIAVMTDRTRPLHDRISQVCGSSRLDSVTRVKIFQKLENLDPAWQEMLNELAQIPAHDVFIPDETSYEQLIVYYLFRYPIYTGRYALECALLTADLCMSLHEAYTLEDIVRRMSVEVEYSDVNPEDLAEALDAIRW